jgi:hypothetical protein
MNPKVLQTAQNKARELGLDLTQFQVQASEDTDFYKVLFLPKQNVRGGGLRVWVGKYDEEVKEVVHLQ